VPAFAIICRVTSWGPREGRYGHHQPGAELRARAGTKPGCRRRRATSTQVSLPNPAPDAHTTPLSDGSAARYVPLVDCFLRAQSPLQSAQLIQTSRPATEHHNAFDFGGSLTTSLHSAPTGLPPPSRLPSLHTLHDSIACIEYLRVRQRDDLVDKSLHHVKLSSPQRRTAQAS